MTDTRHSSLSKRIKAVKNAWLREQQLVKEGKGTRDWTPQQQKDILEKGKAYDDEGFAFEGQHMKSAEKYPEYQEDAGNIQFLTRNEHLEAHKGNWQTPTNWYYNSVTKEITGFGNNPYIPCKAIQLSCPISKASFELKEEGILNNKEKNIDRNIKLNPKIEYKDISYTKNKLQINLKNIITYAKNHPLIIIGLADATLRIFYNNGNKNKMKKIIRNNSVLISNTKEKRITNRPYTPNVVPPHSQHYNLKNGKKIKKDKLSYCRPKKDN